MIARGVLALTTVASFGLPYSGDAANCTNSCHCDCSAAPPEPSPLLGTAAPPEPSPLLGAAAPQPAPLQAQGCQKCSFLFARYKTNPRVCENWNSLSEAVTPLISDQWNNDDKRMFYVTNEELKVPDLCFGQTKYLFIYYSINGGTQELKWGAERDTIDFRHLCCTLRPVPPTPPAPPRRPPRPPHVGGRERHD